MSQRHRRGEGNVKCFPVQKLILESRELPVRYQTSAGPPASSLSSGTNHGGVNCEARPLSPLMATAFPPISLAVMATGQPLTASGPSLFCSGGDFRVLGQCFVIA